MEINHNGIYFITVRDRYSYAPRSYVISSPSQAEAEAFVEGELALTEEILNSDRVLQLVDTDVKMEGKTYVKIKSF